MKNIYIEHSHLTDEQFEKLVDCFAKGMPSLQIAQACGINRNTVNRVVGLIRKRLAELQKGTVAIPRNLDLKGVHFAFRAMAVNPSLNSARESIRLAVLNEEGVLHCEVVSSETIVAITHLINGRINEVPSTENVRREMVTAVMHLVKEFNGKIDSHGKVLEVSSDEECSAQISEFIRFTKKIFSSRRGITVNNFSMHLAECTFRWNNRNRDIKKVLLNEFRKNPL